MVENSDTKGMPVKYPDFAGRVQLAMEANGTTVNDIKAKLSISYEMARRYTLGQALPRPEKLAALAKILNTEPAALQFGVVSADEESADTAPSGWPFSTSKQRYDRLPRDEKERIDGLIEHSVAAWEIKTQTKSRRSS